MDLARAACRGMFSPNVSEETGPVQLMFQFCMCYGMFNLVSWPVQPEPNCTEPHVACSAGRGAKKELEGVFNLKGLFSLVAEILLARSADRLSDK